ncbi:MAG TPA: right-handed parallel beta-helix repeat-containing protein [Candidatus Cybelea sp.]|nr:right-handed parallel beta-helix repeat-containing protein [Candidatus Cybelea sp.]
MLISRFQRTAALALLAVAGSTLAFAPPTAAAPTELVAVPGRNSNPTSSCDRACYYVNATGGSDSANGRTPSTAWRTLRKASENAGPGVTVIVATGDYAPLRITTSGSPDAWVKFVAAPEAHPVIHLNASRIGIATGSGSYILIDGFEVVGQNQTISPAQGHANDGSQPELNENCILVGRIPSDGNSRALAHDVIVRNSIVHDCSASGITTAFADSISIVHNVVYNNSWWGVNDGSGISIWMLTDAVPGDHPYKNYIVGNFVYNNYCNLPFRYFKPVPAITDGNGIIVDTNSHITRMPNVPAYPAYQGRTYIANNIVFANGGKGIALNASSHVDVVNNTVFNDEKSDSPYVNVGELAANRLSHDVYFYNNVAVNLNGKEVDSGVGGTYDYNVLHGSAIPDVGPHDIVADPLLVNPLSAASSANPSPRDFAPTANSRALRSGTDVRAPAVDFFGNPRRAGSIDRGAIQVSRASP